MPSSQPFDPAARRQIQDALRAKYARVAVSPEGNFRYPTGRAGLEGLGYDPALLARLSETVLASFCGVGNVMTAADIQPGERVLDVGCGAGVDALLAALLAGPEGKVTGIDASPEMLARARDNARAAGLDVEFVEGTAENLPFPDASFDVIISSGALNLVLDKATALAELRRVLAPGGRLAIADQFLSDPMAQAPEPAQAAATWAR